MYYHSCQVNEIVSIEALQKDVCIKFGYCNKSSWRNCGTTMEPCQIRSGRNLSPAELIQRVEGKHNSSRRDGVRMCVCFVYIYSCDIIFAPCFLFSFPFILFDFGILFHSCVLLWWVQVEKLKFWLSSMLFLWHYVFDTKNMLLKYVHCNTSDIN